MSALTPYYVWARPGERVSLLTAIGDLRAYKLLEGAAEEYAMVARVVVPTWEDARKVYDALVEWPPELLQYLEAYDVSLKAKPPEEAP